MTLPAMPRRQRGEYVDPPALIARRTTAKARGWRAGWPDDCPTGAAVVALNVVRPADGRVFTPRVDVRLGALFGRWLTMAQELGYPLAGAGEANVLGVLQGGIGSLFCRAIKGSNPPQPSNHSSGTALDLWTRSNPMLVNPAGVPFRSTIHPTAVDLAAAADIYWGGWYWDAPRYGYVDAMHFEYMRRPQDVADSLRKLEARYLALEGNVNTEQVKALQTALNAAMGVAPGLIVDGDYGPQTAAVVAALPARVAVLNAQLDDFRAALNGARNAALTAREGLTEARRLGALISGL